MTKFMIGAATAAHQVEGNNKLSDFWAMEHMKNSNFVEPSNDAVDHYNRYEEDINLLVVAGLNTYRFSIEWARIEPEKGVYDSVELEHYRKVLQYCKDNGLTTVVTLHHFSSPFWLMKEGGWENERVIKYFQLYAKYVISELGNLIDYVCTINEANMGFQIAKKIESYKKAQEGDLQVGLNLQSEEEQTRTKEELTNLFGTSDVHTFLSPRSLRSDGIVMSTHKEARLIIKEINPNIKVGLTLSLHDLEYLDEAGKLFSESEWYDEFSRYVDTIENDDFFGLQNYTRAIYSKDGRVAPKATSHLTQMGYENYPKALENVIRRVAKEISIPIFITENGIATSNDDERVEFIGQAIEGVQRCLKDGLPIVGYLYWSLLDNFEWQKGFSYTFGLIEVDRANQTRYPKRSLSVLGEKSSELLEKNVLNF